MRKIPVIVAAMLIAAVLCINGVLGSKTVTSHGYIGVTMLNQDPDPAVPGSYVDLRWKVDKFGNDEINNLTFYLEPEYPFFFDRSDTPEKVVGDWVRYSDEESYYTLHYKLRVDDDAINDTYTMKLRISYSSPYREEASSVREYDVRVKKNKPSLVLGTMSTSPAKLVSDTTEAKLTVQISNLGEGKALNVQARMSMPPGFEPTNSYSDIYNIGTINASDTKSAIFYADINETVPAGVYQSTLFLKYKTANEDEYKEIELPFAIPVMSKPSFELVSVSTVPAEIRPGDLVQMKVVVRNSGSDKAESVSVRAFKETTQPFTFDDKSDFVGKLEPGDVGEAVLKFTVDATATAKSNLMDIEIRCIHKDEVLVFDKTAKIEVLPAIKKEYPKEWIYGGAAAVLALFVGWAILARKKKE